MPTIGDPKKSYEQMTTRERATEYLLRTLRSDFPDVEAFWSIHDETLWFLLPTGRKHGVTGLVVDDVLKPLSDIALALLIGGGVRNDGSFSAQIQLEYEVNRRAVDLVVEHVSRTFNAGRESPQI